MRHPEVAIRVSGKAAKSGFPNKTETREGSGITVNIAKDKGGSRSGAGTEEMPHLCPGRVGPRRPWNSRTPGTLV